MIRTLTGIGFALALVGSAHAQDSQVTVRLDGKSYDAIRSELHHAAQQVCTDTSNVTAVVDTTCFETSYSQAMKKLRVLAPAERFTDLQASTISRR